MTIFTPEPAVDPRSADGDPSPLPEAAGLRVGWLVAGVITVGVAALVALEELNRQALRATTSCS